MAELGPGQDLACLSGGDCLLSLGEMTQDRVAWSTRLHAGRSLGDTLPWQAAQQRPLVNPDRSCLDLGAGTGRRTAFSRHFGGSVRVVGKIKQGLFGVF